MSNPFTDLTEILDRIPPDSEIGPTDFANCIRALMTIDEMAAQTMRHLFDAASELHRTAGQLRTAHRALERRLTELELAVRPKGGVK